MKILIDADACPVKEIAVRTAKKYGIEVLMFCDTSHILKSDYAKIFTVDKASDSVDSALANKLEKGDIAITQDYGVAALALGRGAMCINQNGLVYTNENIDMLLFERHIGKKMRRAGKSTGGAKKRNSENDTKFAYEFEKLIKSANIC